MGSEIDKATFHGHDFKRFEKGLDDEMQLLREWFADDVFADDDCVAGFELEAWLLNEGLNASASNKQFLEKLNDPLAVPELAQFNIELNGPCEALTGGALGNLHRGLQQIFDNCNKAADELALQICLVGILPTIHEDQLSLKNISNLQRYRALNEQVMRLRQGAPLALNIQGKDHLRTAHFDVMLESAATSLQIHLQVNSQNAARFYNISKILSGPMVGLCANAPFLFNKELWHDTRIPLFEQAVAINHAGATDKQRENRVTFGFGYVKDSLLECFEQNLEHYAILLPIEFDEPKEQMPHVRLHNGTIWRWNRPLIGFDEQGNPHLRIEHRVASSGPTITDIIANMAFFYGAALGLANAEERAEDRLSFTDCKKNFYESARKGLDATVKWFDGEKTTLQRLILDTLLPLAYDGLNHLKISEEQRDRYLGIIENRVSKKQNGAQWQLSYAERVNFDMNKLTSHYLENQHSGVPVHEWGF